LSPARLTSSATGARYPTATVPGPRPAGPCLRWGAVLVADKVIAMSGPAPDAIAPRRVVIAEDEALIRMDLKEMLEEAGYTVVGEAGDGESAVRLAAELAPDLVVLDVKMPVLDGISAAERITAGQLAPVLMLTAFSQRELVERARDAGAMAYLVKPFSKADLVPAIEIAVARHEQMTALTREVADLNERLETRKLVDRAKAVLQSRHGLSESEAFRWIQKSSMDLRIGMRQVAETVLAQEGQKSS